jgi:hypothetical protein
MVNECLRSIFCVVFTLIFGIACQGQTAMEVMEKSNRVEGQQGRYKLEVNGKAFDVFKKVLASGELANKLSAPNNLDYKLTIGGERFEVFMVRRLIVDCSGLDAENGEMVKDLFANTGDVEPSSFVLAGEETVLGIECWKITRKFDANENVRAVLSNGGFGDVREIENYVAKDTFRLHARIVKDSKGIPLLTMRYTDYKDIEVEDKFFALPGEFEKVIPKSREEYLAVLRYAIDVKPRTVEPYHHIRVSAKDMKGKKGPYPNLGWTLWIVGFVALAFLSLRVADGVLSTGARNRKKNS